MADRTHGAMPAPNAGAVLDALLGRLESLEGQVKALQARSAQSLPGDWRFVLDPSGTVKIRRVSTGEECTLCGSAVGSCTVRITAEILTSGPQWCVRIRIPEGEEHISLVTQWGRAPEPVCLPVRPDAPAPDDPGWIYGGSGPPSILTAGDICADYGVGACAFGRYVFRGNLGGEVSLIGYIDPSAITPGDAGPSAFSFDGGNTWGTNVEATISVPCILPAS